MTREALQEYFSESALRQIILANIKQDDLSGQVGHPEYHFDDSAFSAANTYIRQNREMTVNSVKSGDYQDAWHSFGRLTHASQDFYSHSNYINLLAESWDGEKRNEITPEEILLPEIMQDARLVSGKFYSPWEMITFLPWAGKRLARLFPADSHARLNKDSPSCSPLFPIVYQAAVIRTIYEYNEVIKLLSHDEQIQFRDVHD